MKTVKEIENYRCNLTLDIEECIAMHEQKNKTTFKVTTTYQSGREECFSGKLNKRETIPTKAQEKISDLKGFPTVKEVLVEKS